MPSCCPLKLKPEKQQNRIAYCTILSLEELALTFSIFSFEDLANIKLYKKRTGIVPLCDAEYSKTCSKWYLWSL